MKKTILTCASLMVAAGSFGQTTNFFADFEDSAVGAASNSVLDVGTTGGSWTSDTWTNNLSAVIQNAGTTDKAFEFGPTDNSTNHSVMITLDSTNSFATNPIELSFDLAIKPYTTSTQTKALTFSAFNSSDKVVFGIKITPTAQGQSKWRSLSWITDQNNTTAEQVTISNITTIAGSAGVWDNNDRFRIVVDNKRASLYKGDEVLAPVLEFVPGHNAVRDVLRLEINASKQGIQLDDILIMDLAPGSTKTTLGTPIAWLQFNGYTNDYDAADLDDPDGEGLLNWQEFKAGTSITTNNTDGDLFDDYVEYTSGADATKKNLGAQQAVVDNPGLYGWEDASSITNLSNDKTILATVGSEIQLDVEMQDRLGLVYGEWSTNGNPSVQFEESVPAEKAYFRLH
jgi:hypothetical protein